MSTNAPRNPRRALRIGVVLVFLVVAFLGSSPWWFNASRVAALVLSQATTSTGLQWKIVGRPELRWKPMPWLALPKLSVIDAQGAALFISESVEVAVPWSTLRGQGVAIDAVEMDAPIIDVDAVRRWLNTRPESADSPLPTLSHLSIRNGQLKSTEWSLDALSLQLFQLFEGQEARLEAEGVLALGEARNTFSLSAYATPRGTQKLLRFENIRLALNSDGDLPKVDAQGSLQLGPSWALEMKGNMSQWPNAWGELPQPIASSDAPFAFIASQAGADALTAPVSLSLLRNDLSANLRFQPDHLQAWANSAQREPTPPLTGKLSMPALTIDGVRMEDIEMTVEESPSP